MAKQQAKALRIDIPTPKQDHPAWARVGVVGAIGLIVGFAWPTIAGIHIGPNVPGESKSEPTATAVLDGSASAPLPPVLAPTTSAAAAPAGPKPSNKQIVVVGDGRISECWDGKKSVKSEQCGQLRLDPVVAPRLRKLSACPSALGLSGEMQIRFDVDFKQREVVVRPGKKSGLPATTVQGILRCATDYVHDIETDKIGHKLSKYRVLYSLKFYPPGTRLDEQGAPDTGEAEEEKSEQANIATVSYDTALIRDVPRTGKIIARLVRGTRVEVIGRDSDWYRVKIRSGEGWVYRGAIGL